MPVKRPAKSFWLYQSTKKILLRSSKRLTDSRLPAPNNKRKLNQARHRLSLPDLLLTNSASTKTYSRHIMQKTGTLTKARIVQAIAETNGYTQKKALETV